MTAVEYPTVSEQLLRSATEHSLRAFIEPNAIFLAERLHEAYPSETSTHLLATAHLREGNFSRAADILQSATTPENRYLYAVSLVRIGTPESLRDAEAHLRGIHSSVDITSRSTPPPIPPGGAFGLYLLGTICQRTGRKDEAISLYRRAIQANPTLWIAFEALAAMGIVDKVEVLLPPQSDQSVLNQLHSQPQFMPCSIETATPRNMKAIPVQPFPRERPESMPVRSQSQHPLPNGSNRHSVSFGRTPTSSVDPSAFTTPSPATGGSRPYGRSFNEMTTPTAPHLPTGRFGGKRTARRSASPGDPSVLGRASRRTRSMVHDEPSIRNPTDLFATPPAQGVQRITMETTVPSQQPSTRIIDPKAPNGNTFVSADMKSFLKYDESQQSSFDTRDSRVMELLRSLGQLVAELGKFRCSRAISLSNSLPADHRYSSYVRSIRGRAFLERGDYASAEQEFMKALQAEPARMDGVVEYYSTVLWHLKKERELAQLAIRAQKICPVSSSAWCAAGNCFSLQHDPDMALKFFRRAIACSKTPNAYAYTLCGHEYVVKEDFDAALVTYREALHIDERHYNAMYGIGQVLQKQEKLALAPSHFRSAVLVNPQNSMLHYHLGVSIAAAVNGVGAATVNSRASKESLIKALAELETAANLDTRNPVPRFERAKILVAMNRLQDARQQLESLLDSLPKEAEVHFELSRVCQRLGDRSGALKALSVALDIAPKERKYKKALESLNNEMENVVLM